MADEYVSRVRPYLITGGRARAAGQALRLETQVLSTWDGQAALDRLRYEQHDVVRLCTHPRAVAEVGAHLGLHLGVARVLVADLVAVGYLAITDPAPADDRDQVRIIERVINGLSAKR